MIISGYANFQLDATKVIIKKGERKKTQLMFLDARHTSFFIDTVDLLEYLEHITEQVRQIDTEQNPKDL